MCFLLWHTTIDVLLGATYFCQFMSIQVHFSPSSNIADDIRSSFCLQDGCEWFQQSKFLFLFLHAMEICLVSFLYLGSVKIGYFRLLPPVLMQSSINSSSL